MAKIFRCVARIIYHINGKKSSVNKKKCAIETHRKMHLYSANYYFDFPKLRMTK